MDKTQYFMQGNTQHSGIMFLIEKMEEEFNNKNKDFFKNLLGHPDHVIRTRSVCILADIAGEESVIPISNVLETDPDELVRHEAAFSLGQLGFSSGIKGLCKALKEDNSFFVRHEAAIALGVLGSEQARKTLEESLSDPSEEVRKSALVALVNLDYISKTKQINKFTQMTGG